MYAVQWALWTDRCFNALAVWGCFTAGDAAKRSGGTGDTAESVVDILSGSNEMNATVALQISKNKKVILQFI